MTLSAEQQTRLSQLISVELTCARALEEILQREHSALKSHNAEQLLAISREKQLAVERMQAGSRQRERFLASLGVADSKKALCANPEATSTDLWRQLEETALRLREQNEVNGGILTLSQRHNQQALDLLCGRTDSRNTYGSKGQHSQLQSGHSLAKA